MDEDVQQVLSRHRENLEKTVSSLKMKLARSAEEHEQVYEKLMKVKERRSDSSAGSIQLCFSPSAGVSAGERDADYRDQ